MRLQEAEEERRGAPLLPHSDATVAFLCSSCRLTSLLLPLPFILCASFALIAGITQGGKGRKGDGCFRVGQQRS